MEGLPPLDLGPGGGLPGLEPPGDRCLPGWSRPLPGRAAAGRLPGTGATGRATATGQLGAPDGVGPAGPTRRAQALLRLRIEKLSKLYSATCHHRKPSLRNAHSES